MQLVMETILGKLNTIEHELAAIKSSLKKEDTNPIAEDVITEAMESEEQFSRMEERMREEPVFRKRSGGCVLHDGGTRHR